MIKIDLKREVDSIYILKILTCSQIFLDVCIWISISWNYMTFIIRNIYNKRINLLNFVVCVLEKMLKYLFFPLFFKRISYYVLNRFTHYVRCISSKFPVVKRPRITQLRYIRFM